jgi:Tfp pilus assembly protein PilN
VSQQINLFPAALRKQRFSFTSSVAMLAGLGIAAALTVALAVYEEYRLQEVQTAAAAVAQNLKAAREPYEKFVAAQGTRKPDSQAEAKLAQLATQLKGRQDILDALKNGTVGTTAGFSEYMRAFARQSVSGLWLTGFELGAGGNELTITGRALNAALVPSYLQRLNAERFLQGRQFASMRINQASVPREPGKDVQPALPPFLEFALSSSDAGQNNVAQVAFASPPPVAPTISQKPPMPATPLLPTESVVAPRPPSDNGARAPGAEAAK